MQTYVTAMANLPNTFLQLLLLDFRSRDGHAYADKSLCLSIYELQLSETQLYEN